MAGNEDVLGKVAAWIDNGERVAMATVIQTWGSSPRPVGSQLAVTDAGRIAGSVSGGCIEGAVVEAALESLHTGQPKLLTFGVTQERAWQVGLSCGGEIQVLVAPALPRALLAEILTARQNRQTCILATRLADGARQVLPESQARPGPLADATAACLASGRSQTLACEGADWFFHLHAPPALLIITGGVHIAQSLAAMAQLTGADVVICDPRPSYASADRFPATRLRHAWPDEAIGLERPDRNSAMVALSHDPKFDDPALEAALATPCGYIGVLGSRRSHQSRLARLAERGIPPAALARIMGPVGLDIRAVGAAEIAVSILAEWIAQRRGAAPRARV